MKIRMVISHGADAVMFWREDGTVYWLRGWRVYLHVFKLIWQGHQLELDE